MAMTTGTDRRAIFCIQKADGSASVNASLEVRAAFFDEGIVSAVPAGTAEEGDGPSVADSDVEEMLATDEDWKLAVQKDSQTGVGVLTKDDLTEAWKADKRVVTVDLRSLSPSEKLLFDATAKLYAPDISFARSNEALGLPIAQAGLIATGAGLFGLLALKDDIVRPDAMKGAVVFAACAVATSLFGRYRLKKIIVKPARLDLLEKRHEESIQEPLLRSTVGLLLLLAAIVLAIAATWPADKAASPQATIGAPTTTETGAGVTAQLTVTWENLGESVSEVQTTVDANGAALTTSTAPKTSEGEVEDELEVEVPSGASEIEVSTSALDENGDAVGPTYSQVFQVP